MRITRDLARSPLFQLHPEGLSMEERVHVTYERAKRIAEVYNFTAKDLLTLSPKFWEFHTDPIWSMDGAAGTLLTLQYNCCAGTLAMFSAKRADLREVLQEVLDFKVSGQFCLTEVGHGLDVIHLETTATLLENGDFELHTPYERAAKYMPPTAPAGIPCVAIVFARVLVHNEDRGVKAFFVRLHDGFNMAPGVVCKLLPQRGGSRPVNHSLTYFHYVRLPRSALLGSLDKPEDPRAAFFHNISRVAVGTIAIGSLGIPALQMSSFIAARYSQRRTIVNSAGERKPIIEFWTQKAPIVTAVARAFVMKAMHDKAVSLFLDPSLDYRVRHAIASILKVVMIQHAQEAHLTLSERCGAQGLFEVNQLNAMHADMRGTAIAEGDLLGISVRLATELLLGRYEIPHTSDENSLLYKHEAGMFAELREHLHEIKNHRSVAYDRLVLPDSVPLVQAIGHRIAYDAAVAAGVDACLVDLYVATCIKLDPAWYLEELGINRTAQKDMESSAIDAVYQRLEEYLEKMDVESYVSAPLISDTAWNDYVRSLETFGDSTANVSKCHVPCSAGIVAKASFLPQNSLHV